MFGIGDTELLIIAIFAFLLFGPDKLPELGKTVTKGLKQVKHAQDSVTQIVQEQMMNPMQQVVNEVNDTVKETQQVLQKQNVDAPAALAQSFSEQKASAKKERARARDLYNLDKEVDVE